jgi:hypothetical protein
MVLKPQDIFILLKLISWQKQDWTYQELADSLFMSASEVHAGIKRAIAALLMDQYRMVPQKKALEEFIVHGIQYAFPPLRGDITRGMPTAYAAPPLSRYFQLGEELPPVWPDPLGRARGYEFSPLYKSAAKAASLDSMLYELLALIDAIRDGRAREKEIAVEEFRKRISVK